MRWKAHSRVSALISAQGNGNSSPLSSHAIPAASTPGRYGIRLLEHVPAPKWFLSMGCHFSAFCGSCPPALQCTGNKCTGGLGQLELGASALAQWHHS